MFEKIWKDSVWSKVISVIIVAILGLIYAKITSIYDNETFKNSILKVLHFKIELLYIFIVVVTFWILIWLIKMIFSSKKGINVNDYNKKKLYNVNKIIDKNAGVIIKWKVHFDNHEQPFVSDVNCFCTLHGNVPMKFIWNKCPNQDCKNFDKEINEYALINMAESIVLDEWDKINGTKLN